MTDATKPIFSSDDINRAVQALRDDDFLVFSNLIEGREKPDARIQKHLMENAMIDERLEAMCLMHDEKWVYNGNDKMFRDDVFYDACYYGKMTIFDHFFNLVDLKNQGHSFEEACMWGRVNVAERLLDFQNKTTLKGTLRRVAVSYGRPSDMVELLYNALGHENVLKLFQSDKWKNDIYYDRITSALEFRIKADTDKKELTNSLAPKLNTTKKHLKKI